MEVFQSGDVFYFGGPLSISPAYHFEITPRDMARFGLLKLRPGRWNGKWIVPVLEREKERMAAEDKKRILQQTGTKTEEHRTQVW